MLVHVRAFKYVRVYVCKTRSSVLCVSVLVCVYLCVCVFVCPAEGNISQHSDGILA